MFKIKSRFLFAGGGAASPIQDPSAPPQNPISSQLPINRAEAGVAVGNGFVTLPSGLRRALGLNVLGSPLSCFRVRHPVGGLAGETPPKETTATKGGNGMQAHDPSRTKVGKSLCWQLDKLKVRKMPRL